MPGRDHSIRILTAWLMRRNNLSRDEAMLTVLKFGPRARPKLFKRRMVEGYRRRDALLPHP